MHHALKCCRFSPLLDTIVFTLHKLFTLPVQKYRKFTLVPGSTCSRYFQKNIKKQKMFKKFRKKSCTYLSMLRTTVTNLATKRHRMLPGEKRQISDSKFKFSDLICCQKFVFFPQGAYDVVSVRKFSRWCVAYAGTCMIFFGIF